MPVLVRTLALVATVALIAVAAATPAGARFQEAPVVDIQSNPRGSARRLLDRSRGARLVPRELDRRRGGRPRPPAGASGEASFPLTRIGSMRPFWVTVPASGSAFQLGSAQVSASVVISRGKTARAVDPTVLTVQPTVLVELVETAQLQSGGTAVLLDVTAACPTGTTDASRGSSSRRPVG